MTSVVGLVLQLLRDHLGAVADHDDRLAHVALGQRVEHVEHHRPAAQQVQWLRTRRPHPGALAGGEDDGGQPALGHHVRSTPTGLTVPSHTSARTFTTWSRDLIVTIDRDAQAVRQGVVDGRPTQLAPGAAAGLYLWHDRDGWHAFVTHPGHHKVSFTINVTSQAN